MLHIVNKSPLERNALDSCLRVAQDGGAILLMGSALVAMRYQNRIETFIDQRVLPKVASLTPSPQPERPSADAPLEAADYDAGAH